MLKLTDNIKRFFDRNDLDKKRDRRTALRLFRLHWRWLAKTGAYNKDDWPEFEDIGGNLPEPSNSCFLCEFGGKYKRIANCENMCIVAWSTSDKIFVDCCSGEFGKWGRSLKPQHRKKWAKIIAELPVRKV